MKRLLLSLALIGSLVGGPLPSQSKPVDIRLDRTMEKFNLGLSEFVLYSRKLPSEVQNQVHRILGKDLNFSRLFNLVKDGPTVKGKAEALKWASFGSQIVVGGKIRRKGSDQFEISIELYDTSSGKVVFKTRERGLQTDIRDVSHQIANKIYEYFTGEKGIFSSRIAFVNDKTDRKELYLSDYDGYGQKQVTRDNSIVILPRISIDGSKIVFTSYRSGNPDLYIINRDGTGRKKISSKAGLNVSPSWHPNNRQMAVTLSKDGPPNIYLMDTHGKVLRRLTDGKGADTAPAFSPDGSRIAFTSDRPGSPHIYVMNVDGTGLRRLTTDGHCDSSAWSPDGKTLVYVKGKAGRKFDIYSIEVQTGIERRLTWNEGDNENPAWSPDSRSIIFISTRRGRSELYTMAADGSDQRPLLNNMKGKSFTPHWAY